MGLKIGVEGDKRLVFEEDVEEFETDRGSDIWVGENEVESVEVEIGEEGNGGGVVHGFWR